MANQEFGAEFSDENENPILENPEETQQLAILVAEALTNGETHEKIVGDLTNNGFSEEDAIGFVAQIDYELNQIRVENEYQPQQGGEGTGWLIWIGVILGVNLLSWLMGWGFFIY